MCLFFQVNIQLTPVPDCEDAAQARFAYQQWSSVRLAEVLHDLVVPVIFASLQPIAPLAAHDSTEHVSFLNHFLVLCQKKKKTNKNEIH